jgi:hypothetical protein
MEANHPLAESGVPSYSLWDLVLLAMFRKVRPPEEIAPPAMEPAPGPVVPKVCGPGTESMPANRS